MRSAEPIAAEFGVEERVQVAARARDHPRPAPERGRLTAELVLSGALAVLQAYDAANRERALQKDSARLADECADHWLSANEIADSSAVFTRHPTLGAVTHPPG